MKQFWVMVDVFDGGMYGMEVPADSAEEAKKKAESVIDRHFDSVHFVFEGQPALKYERAWVQQFQE